MSSAIVAEALRHVAIAGNPNCGKTTIFNALTGLRQKVANYPGVTVERKIGRCYGSHGELMSILDLPGCYSLQVHSPDEAVARDVLLGKRDDTPRPDVVVAVVDAANLERNLYLVTQLLELDLPVVVALNMVDMAESKGIRIDRAALEKELGVPVIAVVATKGTGLLQLKQALSRQPLALPLIKPPVASEKDDWSEPLPFAGEADFSEERVKLRYEWIEEICARVVSQEGGVSGLSMTDRVDRVLTHSVWGWVAFLGSMVLMFFCIFSLAQVPMEWIDAGASWLGEWASAHLPPGTLQSLVVDGVIAGVGGVVIFLPQILILFFFLGLLEDSGYMARAAFIMDRVMSSVGLHGKSFIPLLSSFACAIPGIMATRTVENRKDRLVTILIIPLMSCSARLPVYALMIAVMIPAASALTKAGIMLSMYLVGIVVAFALAWIFKKTLLKSESSMLLLELPPYRRPSMRAVALRMKERAGIFLRRAGTVILALSILLWALATFPKPSNPDATRAEAISQSFAGQMGHFIEPVIRPLGYDWKIGIGIIGSFAAREVFVGTMAIVYNIEEEEGEDGATLRDTMRAEVRPDGTPVFTPLVCVSLMVFYVLAMQCFATVAVVRRETNSWGWPLFQLGYMTALAWVGAFVVFQGGHLLGFQ